MSDGFRRATVRFASGVDLGGTRLTGEVSLRVAVRDGWLHVLTDDSSEVFLLPQRVVSWVKFERGTAPAAAFMESLLREQGQPRGDAAT